MRCLEFLLGSATLRRLEIDSSSNGASNGYTARQEAMLGAERRSGLGWRYQCPRGCPRGYQCLIRGMAGLPQFVDSRRLLSVADRVRVPPRLFGMGFRHGTSGCGGLAALCLGRGEQGLALKRTPVACQGNGLGQKLWVVAALGLGLQGPVKVPGTVKAGGSGRHPGGQQWVRRVFHDVSYCLWDVSRMSNCLENVGLLSGPT